MVQNVLFTGGASLLIEADNVTVRNVKFQGNGQIRGNSGTNPNCSNGRADRERLVRIPRWRP